MRLSGFDALLRAGEFPCVHMLKKKKVDVLDPNYVSIIFFFKSKETSEPFKYQGNKLALAE